MDNWDEIRTAFQVARLGTVSGAAEVLGVHHATVIRHIDALEGRLGIKLFQRHARGYTATEAGQDLLRVAQATDEQFQQLAGRIKGRGNDMTGELVITSLAGLSPLLAPALTAFQLEHSDLVLRYLTGERLFRLEYGEAHVAIRAGAAPEEPDNVVQPFFRQAYGLYAAKSYADRMGLPDGSDGFAGHAFVGPDDALMRAPFNIWLRQMVDEEAIRFRSSESSALELAVVEGAGIGFLPLWEAARHDDLLEIMPPQESWQVPMWLVTHVDLHRTAKVQTLLSWLKQQARGWGSEGLHA
ncbi:DNA-binding transcriptional regulator, LysR family [Lutimaribacter pacificus]|uniref:DNA-binding transcriptional regulator, LysR family n=1 Tax=Lutimaribacter pacificus TaxID=391948 RepID=A0A1H0HXF1_9RHOB|nr:LysR family transcriptional regulator [Lutimaribacter pacificus]SDO23501.1 DNA-binding transcriptional regulator, LysR family [Lutimaribacter pacificus]SHK30226.1 DNA-binding transcriptional regulator, LysR family [Lutimaribacter pacificus]